MKINALGEYLNTLVCIGVFLDGKGMQVDDGNDGTNVKEGYGHYPDNIPH